MRKMNSARMAFSAIGFALSFLICVPGLKGAASFPKFGYAISPDADGAKLAKIATDAKLKDSYVMLPPILLDFGSGEKPSSAYPAQESAISLMPLGTHLYLHLKVEFGSFSQKGKELESQITLQTAEAIKKLPLDNPLIEGLLVEVGSPISSTELAQFALADIVIKSKSRKNGLKTVFSFPEDFIEKNGEIVRKMANYYDVLNPAFAPNWPENIAWIGKQALNKRIFLKMKPDGGSGAKRFAASYLDAALAVAESSVDVLYVEQPTPEVFTELCPAVAFLSQLAGNDFIMTATSKQPFSVTVEGALRSRQSVFVSAQSQDIGFMVNLETAETPASIILHGPSSSQFETQWYDAINNIKLKPGERTSGATETLQTGIPSSSHTFVVIHIPTESGIPLHSSVEVVAQADLTVEEVIARWQQYTASQNRLLNNYSSNCFMNLHFEAAYFGASGFDVSMALKRFVGEKGLAEWVQSDFYVNGVKFGKGKAFPLPQLEPEKVVSQPLELKLDEKYIYRLEGFDRINGELCYIVGVEPKEQNTSLYSGRIWIHATQFRHVKMELRQRGIKGNVISNIETQHFALIPDGKGHEFNLTKSIYAQQILNAAGRNFVLQKTYSFSDYVTNSEDFESSLANARMSDDPMFRDTDTGLQVLKKEGDKRVPVETGKRVRSIIGGVLYEGSYNFPIPLAGISLSDFNYRKTGTQLSVFFAGPILAANISKQWKSRYRIGVDLALSALPEANRIYSGNTELKKESFYSFEETSGVRATWQPTLNLSLTGAFHVGYNHYIATGDTEKAFVLPRNGVTLTPSFELKYASTGYVFSAGAWVTERVDWRDFGSAANLQNQGRNEFDKYFAKFNKDFYFGKFTKTGFGLEYYGGDKLDRISQYRTSFLSDPRIKGIPSGTDSFDNIGVASVYHGINIFDFLKLEGSYNHAWTRNWGESRHFKGYDGVECDFGTAGPWSTYLQGTVTYAIAGNIDRYNSRWGVYLMIFKPLN